MKTIRFLALAAANATLAACADGPTAHAPTPDDALPSAFSTSTPGVARVVVTPDLDSARIEALTATVTFKATAYDVNNDPIPGAEFAWAGGGTVFSRDAAGDSVVVTALANGATRLVVVSGTRRDTVMVRVRQKGASLTLAPIDSAYLAVGDSIGLTTILVDSLGQAMANPVSWSSAAAEVASVSQQGVVRGLAASTRWTRIRAAGGGLTAFAWIAVRESPVVTHVTLTPGADTILALNRTRLMTAQAVGPDGLPVFVSFSWSSDASGVASVLETAPGAATATVTAVGAGRANITATTTSGVSRRAQILVRRVTGTIALTPASAGIAPGSTQSYDLSVTDLDGAPITPPDAFWASTNTGIATVSAAGLASGIAEGTASIIASRHPNVPAWFRADTASLLVIATPTGIGSALVTTGNPDGRGINVTWNNTSAIETGYELWRSVNGGAFALRTTTAANATSFLDHQSGLASGSTYTYRVRACAAAGCGASSGTTQRTW